MVLARCTGQMVLITKEIGREEFNKEKENFLSQEKE
jgi:hypothetical protein